MKKTKIIAFTLYTAVVIGVVGTLCYQCYTLTKKNMELSNAYNEIEKQYEPLEFLYEQEKTKALRYYGDYTVAQHNYHTTLNEYRELQAACNAVYNAYCTELYQHLTNIQKIRIELSNNDQLEGWEILKWAGDSLRGKN